MTSESITFHAIVLLAQATLLLVFLRSVSVWQRRRSADLRCKVWQLGFLILLMLPWMNVAIAISGVRLPNRWHQFQMASFSGTRTDDLPTSHPPEPSRTPEWQSEADSVIEPATMVDKPSISQAEASREIEYAREVLADNQNATRKENANLTASQADFERQVTPVLEPAQPNSANESATRANWISTALRILFATWLVGTLYGLLRILIAGWQARSLVRHATPINSGRMFELLRSCLQQAGVSSSVHLVQVDRQISPSLVGVASPTLVLPATILSWSEESVRHVFEHEVMHIARRDLAWRLVARATLAVYWFHPVARQGFRAFTQLQEHACDDRVLAIGVDATCYAELLLKLTKHFQSSPVGMSIAIARSSAIEQRIVSILDQKRVRHMTDKRTYRTLLCVGALALLAAAMFQLVTIGNSQSVLAQDDQQKKENNRTVSAPGVDNRDELTYEGESFDYWESRLRTELSGEAKVVALHAVSTFGQNGYEKEALNAIHRTMEQKIGIQSRLVQATYQVGGINALISLLEDEDAEVRHTVCRELQQMNQQFPEVVPVLTKIMETQSSAWNATYAIPALMRVTPLDQRRELEPIVVEAFKSGELNSKLRMANYLFSLRIESEQSVVVLQEFLEGYFDWKQQFYAEGGLGNGASARLHDVCQIHELVAMIIGKTGTEKANGILTDARVALAANRANLETEEYEKLISGLKKAQELCDRMRKLAQ